MFTTYRPIDDVDVITATIEIPILGSLAVNAYVLHGPEPMLVDSGPVFARDELIAALRTVIDPAELRWTWLTHTDFDHIGALGQLLAENERLRVITTFGGVGIMGLYEPLPMDRVNFLNAGETATFGHRTIQAVKPPAFDNPITTGFYDTTSGALFSSDCFGAVLADVPTDATEITATDLRDGQVLWTTVDSPWLHKVENTVLARDIDAIARLEPTTVFSSHLPTAPGHMLGDLLDAIAAVPDAQPFANPDQAALEAMLAGMAAPSQP